MASADNFLQSLGWEPGLRWGREVKLPAGFEFQMASRKRREPLSYWAGLGLTDAFGRALPGLDLPASVLVPAGAGGPAFVVYANFDVIMRWNRSEFYALSVGRLADRIAGAGALSVAPPEDDLKLTRELVATLQRQLNQLGFDAGGADGIFGSGTRQALRAFQADRGLVADGYPDREVLTAVAAAASRATAPR
jgi:membrane-bound lytic murein transglycosylase B